MRELINSELERTRDTEDEKDFSGTLGRFIRNSTRISPETAWLITSAEDASFALLSSFTPQQGFGQINKTLDIQV